MAANTREWLVDVPRSTRSFTLLGFTALGLTLVGFGGWANTAPIAGAVVASGVFVTTGQNKIVQHLEGGVIKEILVKEGDIVETGDKLVTMDDTTPRAELRRLVLRQARLTAMASRLQSEMREDPQILFPDSLLANAADPEVTELLEQQRLTFATRRRNLNSDLASLQDAIQSLDERVKGSNAQLKAVRAQLVFIEEELGAKSRLLEGGLIRKPEVLALQRAQANLEGEIGRILGEIGDTRERIARTQEQIAGAKTAAQKQAVEQLQDTFGELSDVRERVRAAQGVLARTIIVAPVRGAVVKMRYHTANGVIEAGKNVLEIVPIDEELVIQAQVQPRDIESLHRGQAASVRLTALNARLTPMVSGEVIYLSADALPDEKRPMAPGDVYITRVKLNAGEVARIHAFAPTPGMPAEVYIKTAERTFFQYLMKPIQDSMARAFREK
jgi:HlyD family type I secretion membrane fusion protein